MNPNIWGPHAWFLIHSVCLNYPDNPTDEDKKRYINFFTSLQAILPCQPCRKHFKQNMKKYDIKKYLNNKKALLEWCLKIQNCVRKQNNKPELTLNELITYYIKQYNNNNNNNNYNTFNNILLLSCSFIICIIFIIFIIYHK